MIILLELVWKSIERDGVIILDWCIPVCVVLSLCRMEVEGTGSTFRLELLSKIMYHSSAHNTCTTVHQSYSSSLSYRLVFTTENLTWSVWARVIEIILKIMINEGVWTRGWSMTSISRTCSSVVYNIMDHRSTDGNWHLWITCLNPLRMITLFDLYSNDKLAKTSPAYYIVCLAYNSSISVIANVVHSSNVLPPFIYAFIRFIPSDS